MEELKELFGDNLAALITLYKCCPSKSSGVQVNNIDQKELTDEQKLHLAKFTKSSTVRGDKLLICNWKLLAGNKTIDYAKIWSTLQEYVDQVPNSNVRKQMRKRSLDLKYLDCLDEMPEDCEDLTVDEIYEKTGKIVPQTIINGTKKTQKVDLSEFGKSIEEVKDKIDKLAAIDRTKTLSSLFAKLKRLDKDTSYKQDQFKPPEHITKLKQTLLSKTRMQFVGEQLGYSLFNLMCLEGYKPVIITPIISGQGDYDKWTVSEYLEFSEVLEDGGQYCMESYDEPCKVGLAKDDAPIQHLQYQGRTGVHDTINTSFLVKAAKSVLERTHKDTKVHKYIRDNYLDQPKGFYITKKKSGNYKWNYYNISLDIYHNENLVIPPYALETFKNIFGGKEPDEWIGNYKI